MSDASGDRGFTGAVAKFYETRLVPLIFASYAEDLAQRLAGRPMQRLLEIACGTGVVTRALATRLPPSVDLVATDLNQAMLDQAAMVGTTRPVTWQQADAMQLPFADAEFDAVVCQFGVMFFPDRAAAFSEVRRVLRPGGLFLFNVWDRIEENDFAQSVTDAMASLYPADPPRFMARVPHGYFNRAEVEGDLRVAGFRLSPTVATVTARSRAATARDAAIAYVQGTPLRNEIEARGGPTLEEATERATAEIARRFGDGPVDGKIQALVFAVVRES